MFATLVLLLTLAPQGDERELIDALLAHDLLGLAEAAAGSALEGVEEASAESADLRIRLSSVRLRRILRMDSPQRARAWESLRTDLERAADASEDEVAETGVRLHLAGLQAQWARSLVNAAPEQAAVELMRSLATLQSLRQATAGPATDSRRASVASAVRQNLIAVGLLAADTLPEGADRSDALQTVAGALRSPGEDLSDLSPERLRQLADVLGRLGRRDDARLALAALPSPAGEAERVADTVASLRLRLLEPDRNLAALAAAARTLATGPDAGRILPEQWPTLLAVLFGAANGEPPPAELEPVLLRAVDALAASGQPTLQRRAAAALASAAPRPDDPEVQDRLADFLSRHGEVDAAARQYRMLAARTDTVDPAAAVRALRRAAAVMVAEGRFDEAIRLLQGALDDQQDDSRAAELLYGLVLAARAAYQRQPTRPSLDRLRDFADEFARRFPDAPAAAAVAVLRGYLLTAARQYPEAIAALEQVPAGTAEFGTALRLRCDAYTRWLRPLGGIARGVLRDELADGFGRLGRLLDADGLDAPVRGMLFATWCRMGCDVRLRRTAAVRDLWRNGRAVPAPLAVYRLLAAAMDEDGRAAEQVADDLRAQSPEVRWQAAALLNDWSDFVDPSDKRLLGQLAGRVTDDFAAPLADGFERTLQTARARVNSSRVDQLRRTRNVLEQLRTEKPADPRVAEALGHALMRLREDDRAAALWRTLETGVRPQSTLWFRARLNRLLVAARSQDAGRIRAAVDSLAILYPDLGGDVLKRRFEELARTAGRLSG